MAPAACTTWPTWTSRIRVEQHGRRLPPDDPVPPAGGPARPRAAGGDPRARGKCRYLVRAAGAEAVVVPARGTADQILAALPADVDAVYLTPIPALADGRSCAPDRGAQRAAAAHAEPHRRPTCPRARSPPTSRPSTGAAAPAGWRWTCSASWPARTPARCRCGWSSAPRLTLNLATARTIGFSPGYSVRTDAELVGTDSLGPADTRLAGRGDARRGGGQPRSQGRGPRGGVGPRRTCDSPAPACSPRSRAGSAER